MFDTNPTLIQSGPTSGHNARTPLFLIHDGSGLISSYFWLGSLCRNVYGIHNPRFDSGGDWEHGLHDMAKAYVPLIKSVVPHGKILIGGWSLGGLVSLEIARLLTGDPDVTVAGLLLVDTAYPKCKVDDNIASKMCDHFEPPPGISQALHLKLHDVFSNARRMINEWNPPNWRDQQLKNGTNTRPLAGVPPPAVLLKAADYVFDYQSTTSSPERLATVDTARQSKRLGWDEYEHRFIRVVLDVNGNHFSTFAPDKVQKLTTKINMACAMLDQRH